MQPLASLHGRTLIPSLATAQVPGSQQAGSPVRSAAAALPSLAAAPGPASAPSDEAGLRRSFDQFVGETFFGQMLAAMRKTQGRPAYFHGGRAEEAFRGQLDQMLAREMSTASADTFTGPMFELFTLHRS